MPTCPACGKEQPGASAFCAACGAVLDRPQTDTGLPAPPVTPTQVIPPAMPSAHAARYVDDFGDVGQYIARRLAALLVDLIGVTLLLAAGIQFLFVRAGQDAHSYGTFFATGALTLFALILYLCITEAYVGTTLGKALLGLRVTPTAGGRVGIGRAVVRNVFLPFDLLGIGFILAALTPRRRRIGDFVVGTEVVNAHLGVFGPAAAAIVLGAWGYAEYAFADGLRMAQTLSGEAQTYGPSLIGGQPTPQPGPTPLPDRTPVPTEQPITVPTIAPTTQPTPSTTHVKPNASPISAGAAPGRASAAPGASPPLTLPSMPATTPAPTTPPSPTPASSPTTS